MVSWLMPIAVLPKTYTFFFFDSFAQIAVLIFSGFILLKAYMQPKILSTVLPETRTLKIWGVFITLQLILMTYQSYKLGDSPQIYGLLHGFISFIQMILVIWIAYTVQKMVIQKYEDAVKFFKSVIWTFVGYFILIILPQILFILGINGLSKFINLVAKLFERHWLDRDFYNFGSYVTTQFRLNGLEPEASFLALLIGISFAPIILMIIQEPLKTFKRKKYIYWMSIVLMLVIMCVLLLAKTTTGLLMIGLLALIYWVMASNKQKIWLTLLALFALLLLVVAYQNVTSIHNLLNNWLFNKSGTDNRLGGTIGLIGAWFNHPLFGVGYGYEGHYIVQNLPDWSKNNVEYMQVYKNQSYPILNDLFGWLARFGLVFVLCGAWLLAGLLKRAGHVLRQVSNKQDEHSIFYRITIKSFFVTVALIIIVAAITPVNATSWPTLLMLFFYWRVIHIAENDVFTEESEQ